MVYDRLSTPSRVRDPASSRTSPEKRDVGPSASPTMLPEMMTQDVKVAMPTRKPVPPPKDLSPQRQPQQSRQEADTNVETGAIPIVRDFAPAPPARPTQPARPPSIRNSDAETHARERREAILQALAIISSVSRGLYVPEPGHVNAVRQWRLV